MFAPSSNRCEARLRMKASKSLGKESKKDAARLAALVACEHVLRSHNLEPTYASVRNGSQRNPSFDMSGEDDDETDFSHFNDCHNEVSDGHVPFTPELTTKLSERSAHLGSIHGLRDERDFIANSSSSLYSYRSCSSDESSSDYDITTVTEAVTDATGSRRKTSKSSSIFFTPASQRRRQRRIKQRRSTRINDLKKSERAKDGMEDHDSHDVKKKLKLTKRNRFFFKKENNSAKSAADKDTQEVWMCGVCGKTFHQLDAAEKHEEDHIQYVVSGLGWLGCDSNSGFVNTPTLQSFTGGGDVDDLFDGKSLSRFRTNTVDSFVYEQPSVSDHFHQKQQRRSSKIKNDAFNDRVAGERRGSRSFFSGEEKSSEGSDNDYKPALDIDGSQNYWSPVSNQVHFEDSVNFNESFRENGLAHSSKLNNYLVLADEALVSVCARAEPMILTAAEIEAERLLNFLAKDKLHYDQLIKRAIDRSSNPSNRFRSERQTRLARVQNKFVDAYQLMKQGDNTRGVTDQYNKTQGGEHGSDRSLVHSSSTLYVNVMVKNSVHVVRQELEKMAVAKWERPEDAEKYSNFQRFRVYAHVNIVRLAGIALASDFTPRRIAIQLSNDLYRLLTPRLKRRGVTIETEIEYRVGGYFVLAVNICTINWRHLIKANRKDVLARVAKWHRRKSENNGDKENDKKHHMLEYCMVVYRRFLSLTISDIVVQIFFWLYYVHWIIQVPTCLIAYHTFFGGIIRKYILQSVTDDIFFYVEERGMEMEIVTSSAQGQTALMLSALREIRADGRELKKKQKANETQQDSEVILGPLLGPPVKADKQPAVKPPDFEMPQNLEFVSLELDLPVGFRRVRWALLNSKSKFLSEAYMKEVAKNENITFGSWSKHDDYIGLPTLPDNVKEGDFVGAEKESSSLMPKSAFVSANMCYEVNQIKMYNDYCFSYLKKSLNPDVPFGKTFCAWTQYTFINLGKDSCRMICSVEAEFPNGPPMVARQIQSGMRAGTAEVFVALGETITRYAQAFP